MRYAIISDIHSNLSALQAALLEIESLKVDHICCLGDTVGYNYSPCECIDIVRDKVKYCIAGNHDHCAIMGLYFALIVGFSTAAFKGMEYTISKLNDDNKQWLKSLSIEKVVQDKELSFLMVHGEPDDCDGYILNHDHAVAALACLKKRDINFCFYGHTHIPAFAVYNEDDEVEFYTKQQTLNSKYATLKDSVIELDLSNVSRFMINPGSIGQPRRGCGVGFGIFDTDKQTFQYRSFEYDVTMS